MNSIIISDFEVCEDRVVLTDYRARHIVKILKCKKGDILKVGIIGGSIGKAKVTCLKVKYPFSVNLQVTFDREPPEKNPIDFILALPRPIMLRRIFSQITALGVSTVHIVNANRVEKSFWEASLINEQEYRQYLVHGLEQAVDTILPKICFHRRFKPFMEDFFPSIAAQYKYLLYAHPTSSSMLHKRIWGDDGKALIAIGPEGGWVDYEIEQFVRYGFIGFSIGPRILKVDTAIVNIHGRAMAEFDRCR